MNKKIVLLGVFTVSMLFSCGSSRTIAKRKALKKNSEVVVKKRVKKKNAKVVAHVAELKKDNPALNTNALAYMDKYAEIAMDEMRKYQIPASITLAQGMLESTYGTSELSLKSNNHFGVKCHKGWNGGRVYHDDDEKGECFRKYKYVNSSYQDHSLFLTQRSRYAFLFDLDIDDYKGWAKGLKKAGYATDKKYPAKLIRLIENYELYKLDALVLGKKGRKYKIKKKKKQKVYIVQKGDTLYSISKRYNLSVQKLKKLNNLKDNIISLGQELIVK